MSPAQCLCGIYAPAWIGVSFENEMLPVFQSFSGSIFLMNLAGFPPTTVIGGTSQCDYTVDSMRNYLFAGLNCLS